MIEALHFLRKAIIDRLSGSIVLNSQNVPVYNRVPSDATEPFIKVYSLQNEETDFNRDSYMLECITRIDVVTSFDGDSGGELDANEIVSQVLNLVRTREGTAEFLKNGDFSDGSNYWSITGDVSISGNKATWEATDEVSKIVQSNVFEIGKKYKIFYKIEDYTEGGLKIVDFGDGTTATDTNLIQENGSSFIEGIAGKVDFEIKRRSDPVSQSISNLSIQTPERYFDLTADGFKVYTSVLMNTTYFEEDAEDKTYFRAIIELSNKVQKI